MHRMQVKFFHLKMKSPMHCFVLEWSRAMQYLFSFIPSHLGASCMKLPLGNKAHEAIAHHRENPTGQNRSI